MRDGFATVRLLNEQVPIARGSENAKRAKLSDPASRTQQVNEIAGIFIIFVSANNYALAMQLSAVASGRCVHFLRVKKNMYEKRSVSHLTRGRLANIGRLSQRLKNMNFFLTVASAARCYSLAVLLCLIIRVWSRWANLVIGLCVRV